MNVLFMEAFMKNAIVEDQRGYFFLACLIPLLATDLIRILVSYHYSVDRGMWPVVLLIWVGVSFLYSGMAYLLAHLTRHYNVALALRNHALLGLVLVAYTFTYYLAKPDWLAVNSGLVRLTTLEKVINHHWTPWAFYLFFYVLLIVRLHASKRQGQTLVAD
jgi:hypothetical protein